MKRTVVVVHREAGVEGFDVALVDVSAGKDGIFGTVRDLQHKLDVRNGLTNGYANKPVISNTECLTELLTDAEALHYNKTSTGFEAVGKLRLGNSLLVGRIDQETLQNLPGESAFTNISSAITALRIAYADELEKYRSVVQLVIGIDRIDLIAFRYGTPMAYQYRKPLLEGISFDEAANLLLSDLERVWRTSPPDLIVITGQNQYLRANDHSWVDVSVRAGSNIVQFESERLFQVEITDVKAQQRLANPFDRHYKADRPILLVGAAAQYAIQQGCDLKGVVSPDAPVQDASSLFEKMKGWFSGGSQARGQSHFQRLAPHTWAILSVIGITIMFGSIYRLANQRHETAVTRLDTEKRREKANEVKEKEAQTIAALIKANNERADSIDSARKARTTGFEVLNNVANAAPAGVSLTKTSFRNREVVIDGYVSVETASQATAQPTGTGSSQTPPAAPPNPKIDVADQVDLFKSALQDIKVGGEHTFSPDIETKYDLQVSNGKANFVITCRLQRNVSVEPIYRAPIPPLVRQITEGQSKGETTK